MYIFIYLEINSKTILGSKPLVRTDNIFKRFYINLQTEMF